MVQAHRIKTVAIVGCTAVGKSDTALKLAERYNGVLVGADSMQVYRKFDIGTGKLTKQECRGIEHKLIDVVDGDADFSVGEYVRLANAEIAEISNRGKLPIIVGGTGMYVYSLLSGCNFSNAPKDERIRSQLKIMSHFFGGRCVHKILERVDKPSADVISSNDVKRTIRALEIYFVTGEPKSRASVKYDSPYDAITIVLTLPRELMYAKINERVKKMFDMGLQDEVKSLMKFKNCGSMQALGYKQIAQNPDLPREEVEPIVAQKTRNYAKRQMTYFNNMKLDNTVFIDARDFDEIERVVKTFLDRNDRK